MSIQRLKESFLTWTQDWQLYLLTSLPNYFSSIIISTNESFSNFCSPKTFHLHFSFLPISHKELFGDKVPIIFVSFPPFPHQGRWTGGAMSIPSWKITILAFYRGEQDFLLDFFFTETKHGIFQRLWSFIFEGVNEVNHFEFHPQKKGKIHSNLQ